MVGACEHSCGCEVYFIRSLGRRLFSGLKHRSNRPIEPEAVFGQMKYNMQYKRFRHFGKDKVTMDFAFFAIAFNIKKMAAKVLKQGNMPTNGGQCMHPATSYMRVWGLVWSHKAENMKKAA